VLNMNAKIVGGVLWNLASLFASRGSAVVFTLFLARFLSPNEFGLLAMAAITFDVGNVLSQSGLGQAIIRSKSIDDKELSTAFFANLGLSTIVYAFLFTVAPYFAGFYDQPELALIVRVVALVVFLNAAKLVQTAIFTREMNFQIVMIANATGTVASGACAVAMAYLGAGVWSLVAQILIAAAVSSSVLWGASGWRPSITFDLAAFKRLYGFGSRLAVEGVLELIYQNSYILVIGRLFSPELTGIYFFARKVSSLISQQLTGAVQQASLPALATLQDSETALRLKYRQIVQLMLFAISPVMLIGVALAEPLVQLLFSEDWAPAVPFVQLLSLIGVLYPLHAMNMNVLYVTGRSDLVLKVGLIKKAIAVALLVAMIPYGVLAIVAGQVVSSLLALIPNAYYSKRLIGYGLRTQLSDVAKPVGAATTGALGAFIFSTVTSVDAALTLLLSSACGLVFYATVSWIARAEGLSLALSRRPTAVSQVRTR
jgi:O-antigen/teichoic acid export membrane protein